MSGRESQALGHWGEDLAAEELRKQGCRILSRNWKCRMGELDLVVEDGRYLCFVEVKLRKSRDYGTAGEAVDGRKQHKLYVTAQLYLQRHPTSLQPRFDVVEIEAPQGMDTKAPRVRRIENAF